MCKFFQIGAPRLISCVVVACWDCALADNHHTRERTGTLSGPKKLAHGVTSISLFAHVNMAQMQSLNVLFHEMGYVPRHEELAMGRSRLGLLHLPIIVVD